LYEKNICRNVFGNVMGFLKAKDVTGIVDRPVLVLEEPEIYKRRSCKSYTPYLTKQKGWPGIFPHDRPACEQEVMQKLSLTDVAKRDDGIDRNVAETTTQ
jgi:hypothetical protein